MSGDVLSEVGELAKRLVEIPSYVSDGHDEQQAIDFLEAYVKEKLPTYECKRSVLEGESRSNLYLTGKKPTRLLFVGHVDTVMPSDGWDTSPLDPVVKSGAMYGLGIADMKGSIASLLIALQQVDTSLLDETAVLLYLDEEYSFAGMYQLLRDKLYTKANQPELIISLDGGLSVLSGCRGLLKIDMEVIGKSGHASNPANGINVITHLTDALREVDSLLPEYGSDSLGKTTMNVAYMRAGAVEDVDNPEQMQKAGNVIPNYADCIVEFRPATPRFNGEEATRIIQERLLARGLEVKKLAVKHDLGAWLGSFDSSWTSFIEKGYSQAGIAWEPADPQYIGFIDVQMLCEVVDTPTYVIGAGGVNRHGANEHTPLEDLDKAMELYKILINNFFAEK